LPSRQSDIQNVAAETAIKLLGNKSEEMKFANARAHSVPAPLAMHARRTRSAVSLAAQGCRPGQNSQLPMILAELRTSEMLCSMHTGSRPLMLRNRRSQAVIFNIYRRAARWQNSETGPSGSGAENVRGSGCDFSAFADVLLRKPEPAAVYFAGEIR